MRTWIIALGLCLFFFIIPLQFFVIGENNGWGIQGAVYRYQVTGSGISLIPVTHEIGYVTSGIYEGKTALSVIFWATGTLVLACTLILSFNHAGQINDRLLRFIRIGVAGSIILFLGSLVAQYGLFFSGPAGISLPAGILIMGIFAAFLYGNKICNITADA